MTRSLYLRLAAPVMTWGGSRVTPKDVDTAKIPTRTALEGLLAACLGVRRDQQFPAWLAGLRIAARQEHRPIIASDFQTIGPGEHALEHLQKFARMTRAKKPGPNDIVTRVDAGGNKFVIARRHLQDTEYLVSIRAGSGQDEAVVDTIHAAVHDPVFSPYLGRKANAPTFPLLIGVAEAGLITTAPAIRRPDDRDQDSVRTVSLASIAHTIEPEQRLEGIPVLDKTDWMTWWADHREPHATVEERP